MPSQNKRFYFFTVTVDDCISRLNTNLLYLVKYLVGTGSSVLLPCYWRTRTSGCKFLKAKDPRPRLWISIRTMPHDVDTLYGVGQYLLTLVAVVFG